MIFIALGRDVIFADFVMILGQVSLGRAMGTPPFKAGADGERHCLNLRVRAWSGKPDFTNHMFQRRSLVGEDIV